MRYYCSCHHMHVEEESEERTTGECDSERPDPVLERVKEKAMRVFRVQAVQEPGSWVDRTWQCVRGKVVSQLLTEQVDQALAEEWTAFCTRVRKGNGCSMTVSS